MFLKNHHKMRCGETRARHFSKKIKSRISLDQQPRTLYSLLLLHVQIENYQNILCWPPAFISLLVSLSHYQGQKCKYLKYEKGF